MLNKLISTQTKNGRDNINSNNSNNCSVLRRRKQSSAPSAAAVRIRTAPTTSTANKTTKICIKEERTSNNDKDDFMMTKHEQTKVALKNTNEQCEIEIKRNRLFVTNKDKTGSLNVKMNGVLLLAGVAYALKNEGAFVEIETKEGLEINAYTISLESPSSSNSGEDMMAEMLAKSFEMTASIEVRNALKVEKMQAGQKLSIHTKGWKVDKD
jgi:hypothetical protein